MRDRIALVLICLLINGCGFQPMYSTENNNSLPIKTGTVSFEKKFPKVALGFKKALEDALNPDGSTHPESYIIDVTLTKSMLSFGTQSNAVNTRQRIDLTANYKLRDIKTAKIITEDRVVAMGSFEITQSAYSNVVSEEETLNILARNLASEIKLRVAGVIKEKANNESEVTVVTSNNEIIHKPFYFLRHGQTDYNKFRKAAEDGSSNTPLNEEGILQAHNAAKMFKDMGIDGIVSSPLIRAQQTAEIVAGYLNVPIIYCDDLQEVRVGVLGGIKRTPEMRQQIIDWMAGKASIEGAQPIEEVKSNIAGAINQALSQYKFPLIVAHGRLYTVLRDITGNPYEKTDNAVPLLFKPPGESETSWSVLKL